MEPKVLIYDLECSPTKAWVWTKWQTNAIGTVSDWYLLSFSVKWVKGKQVTKALPDYKSYRPGSEDDRELCKELWEYIDSCDILVGQNSDAFDIKKMNTRFLNWGLPPPSPYRTMDTKKIAKKYFALFSNALDDMGEFLKIGRKIETNFNLWKGCMRGDKKSWRLMKRYNANDVRLTEKLYLMFLPWASPPTPLKESGCPRCGGELIKKGFQYNKTTKYQRVQCTSCKGWSRIGPSLQKNKPPTAI